MNGPGRQNNGRQKQVLTVVSTAGIVVGNVQQRTHKYLQALSWQRQSVQGCA